MLPLSPPYRRLFRDLLADSDTLSVDISLQQGTIQLVWRARTFLQVSCPFAGLLRTELSPTKRSSFIVLCYRYTQKERAKQRLPIPHRGDIQHQWTMLGALGEKEAK
ncbi:hypothetical protein PoB_003234600 [Plakobranchus ocellatus]|uniref:Uncharacterized protein n=1 Tax=Plakobranchus ocellatus TaxID=259542 RepID=A0AAV4ABX0_9GAST|nr:hypothetical protein PoB_003234600 [Plakobranchus ocellatus]